MNEQALRDKLELHRLWLEGSVLGKRAIFSGNELCYTTIAYAALNKACFSCADIRGAALTYCDLSEASFTGADCRGVNFRYSNLTGADFREACISLANFDHTIRGAVCRMDFGGWSICIHEDITTIGCQLFNSTELLEFTPDSPEIRNAHCHAQSWWVSYGPAVKAAIRCVQRQYLADNVQAPEASSPKTDA